MVDLNTLADIVESKKCDGTAKIRAFAKEVEATLVQTRKLLSKQRDFVLCPQKEEAYKWLEDNCTRLEETAKNEVKNLLSCGKILVSAGKPFFFDMLYYYVSRNGKLEKGEIDGILEICNRFDGGISLQDARAVLHILRLAVCVRICRVFCDILGNKETDTDTGCIQSLFLTLDELCFVDVERAYSFNAVEKELMRDPDGLYEKLTPATKACYRKNLICFANKKKLSQITVAQSIVKECKKGKGSDRHIGKYLCDKPFGGGTYLFLIGFMTFIFTLLLCLVSPVFIAAFFSVYGASKLIADKFFSRYVVKDFYLPRLDISEIPDGCGVMTVLTSLVTGKESDKSLFESLENMYFSNRGRNVYFGLLCDLPDSDEKSTKRDAEIIEAVSKEIRTLRKKHGNVFFLFVREREYSNSEEKYIAPERKRGAVNSLCEFLCNKSDCFSYGSIKPDERICKNIKYVLTLDADTNLAFDCIRSLVGIMLHPQNSPVWDKKKAVVTKGYGILQPAVNPTLDSSGKSFFSSVLSGHGGVDMYSFGGTDFNMSVFGRSIFCGKGMFDKNCFCDILCGENSFENESVLSHDSPEGARLRCAYVSDVVLNDSFPSEPLSYYKRQHRWIRGDLQNIPFLLSYVKNSGGKRIRNYMGKVSKFFIWENVSAAMLPVFTLILLVASCFLKQGEGTLLVSVCLAPYILQFVNSFLSVAKRALWHNFRRCFYSKCVYSGVWTDFLKLLFRISALPQSAFVSADAALRCTCRMLFSHRKKLEWTTAAQNDAEKRDGLLGYIKKFLPCAVLGTFVFVVSPAGIVRLLGLMWLFAPVLAYHSGKELRRYKGNLTKRQRDKLMVWCEDMWRYFDENVTEKTNYLPPDNVSLHPERKVSRMTSPTNIGLYLLSLVCAGKLGIKDSVGLLSELKDTLVQVDKLEKFHGLLYNWYDVFKAEPMTPKYVSAVDLGNYVACLICVKEALKDLCRESSDRDETVALCEKLIAESDLSFLYDKDKKLFCIGAVEKEDGIVFDKNFYDMLMSEARILSFTAVALKMADKNHLARLSRRLVQSGGYMGLASWNGTAFEYFMPEIFMPAKHGSLVYEGLCFAFSNITKKTFQSKQGAVFGISESCCNELDSLSNYKYRAFGVQKIAVNSIDERKVVSPYSSFLCMHMSGQRVLSNLVKLEKLGAYGEYGFFESVDFDNPDYGKNHAVVRCFMAHHIGMSIASCTNVLCENAVAEWFANDRRIRSALSLTQEKIPYDVYVKNLPRRHFKKRTITARMGVNDLYYKKSRVKLESENLYVNAKRGRLSVKYNNLLAVRKKLFAESLDSFEVCVSATGNNFVFDGDCILKTDNGQIVFAKTFVGGNNDMFDGALSVTVGTNTSDTLRMRIRLRRLSGAEVKTARLSLSFCPLLDTAKNSEICSFFDERDIVLKTNNDGTEVFFSRLSTGRCLYAGCVHGYDKRAYTDGEKVTLECKSLLQNGIFEAEFALSFSHSRICAETGFVRCRQDSFINVSEQLRQKSIQGGEGAFRKDGAERKSDVLGCYADKKEIEAEYPIDSKEREMFLLASKEFCALCPQDGLGVSFVKDINRGRITSFSGVSLKKSYGERLICDGFDLCRDSRERRFEKGECVYVGSCKGAEYSVKVCVLPDYPCKIITVNMQGCRNLRLSIVPSDNCDGERHIGSGIAFFSGVDEAKKGFVFGICDVCGRQVGANYGIETEIVTEFILDESENAFAEYTFCVGYTKEDEAFEIFRNIREMTKPMLEKAALFSESLFYDAALMSDTLKSVLPEYFVFPKQASCKRAFVKSSPELFLFDVLLMMYSSFDARRDYVIKAFGEEGGSEAAPYLLCLILSEYVRLTKDAEVAELRIGGDTLYKRCLSYLFREDFDQKYKNLFLASVECFSFFCEAVGDMRTCIELRERAKLITQKKNGGIFL